MVRVGIPARPDLEEASGGIGDVEQRKPPHLPQAVARVRVIGELNGDGPALFDPILDLGGDLGVGEIGQAGKRSLGDSHDRLLVPRTTLQLADCCDHQVS